MPSLNNYQQRLQRLANCQIFDRLTYFGLAILVKLIRLIRLINGVVRVISWVVRLIVGLHLLQVRRSTPPIEVGIEMEHASAGKART